MKSLIKLLLGLAGLCVIVLIAIVITLATLDPNEHKDWISEKALAHSGRTLALGGDIKISYYPWLGVEASDIKVGNAAGFSADTFFQADYLNLRVKLMPLFKQQYQVDTVIVRGAVVNLEKNKDGVSNWDDLLAEEKSDEGSAIPLAAIVLGGVDIASARLSWNDQGTDTRYEISNMNFRTDALSYGEPLKINMDMDLTANKPALDGNINLSGTIAYDIDDQLYDIQPLEIVARLKGGNIPGGESTAKLAVAIKLNLDEDTAVISGLQLDALDTQVSGSLNASRIQTPGPSVQAAIKVRGADLALLFKVAEIEPLASQVAKLADRSFTLDTSVDADMKRGDIDVSGLSLAMLGATVKAEIKANNILSETPAYKGQLKAAGPDLPTLLQVLGQFQGGKESTLSQYGQTFAQGKHKAFKVDANFDADLKSGNVDVSGLAVQMLGATVEGDIKASKILSKAPGYQGHLKAAGPDLPTLLQVIGRTQGAESALSEYGRKFASLKDKDFKIDSGFSADMSNGDIDIPTLDIDALGIAISGKLTARQMHTDKGSVSGKLNISGNKLAGLLTALDQKGLSEVLKTIDLTAGISGNADNIDLKPMALKLSLAGEQLGKTPVDVALNADTSINLAKQNLQMAGLSLTGLGLNVSGAVQATNYVKDPAFSGNINVAPFDLRSLMTKLNQELPPTADKKVFSKLGFATHFAGSTNKLEVEQLSMVLDQTNLKGKLSVVDFAKPAISFAINIDQIDADRYMSPVEGANNKPLTPETAAGAAVQLPVETLQALNVKGNLSIGKLTVSKAKLSDVKLSLDGKDGNITLAPVAANLYQGSYSGKITIDANGKLPKLVVNSALKGVQIEPLLMDTTGSADLVGKGDISIAVVARGNNTDIFKQTLSGQAELRVSNGIVRGVDIQRALEQVEIMIESKRFGKVNTEGNTPFSSLTATLPINAGVVSNNDLLLTAPGFKVTGQGTLARLTDMTWRYDLKVDVDERSVARNEKTYNIGDYSIPIICRGKIAGSNCTPDKMDLAGAAVKKIILDKLTLPGTGDGAETNATGATTDPKKELLDKALKSIFK